MNAIINSEHVVKTIIDGCAGVGAAIQTSGTGEITISIIEDKEIKEVEEIIDCINLRLFILDIDT
jgi:hypothetical protein